MLMLPISFLTFIKSKELYSPLSDAFKKTEINQIFGIEIRLNSVGLIFNSINFTHCYTYFLLLNKDGQSCCGPYIGVVLEEMVSFSFTNSLTSASFATE